MMNLRRFARRLGIYFALPGMLLLIGAILGAAGVRTLVQSSNKAEGAISSAHGVNEAGYVRLGGVRQWVTVRGLDRRKPLLLYLHGGPGGVTSDFAYSFQRPWEEYFTVVQWDQRGFGRSAIDGHSLRGTVTRKQTVADAIALIEHLRNKFGQSKVVLAGHSWGSLLGAEIAKRRPDLLHAYVGMGQVTGWERNFLEIRDALAKLASRTNNKALAQQIAAAGDPPPARDGKAFLAWASKVQKPVLALGGTWHNVRSTTDFATILILNALGSPTLSLAGVYELLNADPAAAKLPLVESAAGWEFRSKLGTHFEVPMIFISGRFDLQAPTAATVALANEICSPYTSMVIVDQAAHVLVKEQPGKILNVLINQVLPLTENRRPAGGRTCRPTEPASFQRGHGGDISRVMTRSRSQFAMR